eukprot:62269-Chlamydomonas_euryale.AAC.4
MLACFPHRCTLACPRRRRRQVSQVGLGGPAALHARVGARQHAQCPAGTACACSGQGSNRRPATRATAAAHFAARHVAGTGRRRRCRGELKSRKAVQQPGAHRRQLRVKQLCRRVYKRRHMRQVRGRRRQGEHGRISRRRSSCGCSSCCMCTLSHAQAKETCAAYMRAKRIHTPRKRNTLSLQHAHRRTRGAVPAAARQHAAACSCPTALLLLPLALAQRQRRQLCMQPCPLRLEFPKPQLQPPALPLDWPPHGAPLLGAAARMGMKQRVTHACVPAAGLVSCTRVPSLKRNRSLHACEQRIETFPGLQAHVAVTTSVILVRDVWAQRWHGRRRFCHTWGHAVLPMLRCMLLAGRRHRHVDGLRRRTLRARPPQCVAIAGRLASACGVHGRAGLMPAVKSTWQHRAAEARAHATRNDSAAVRRDDAEGFADVELMVLEDLVAALLQHAGCFVHLGARLVERFRVCADQVKVIAQLSKAAVLASCQFAFHVDKAHRVFDDRVIVWSMV